MLHDQIALLLNLTPGKSQDHTAAACNHHCLAGLLSTPSTWRDDTGKCLFSRPEHINRGRMTSIIRTLCYHYDL